VAALASKQDIEDIKSTSWWGWDGGRQKGKREGGGERAEGGSRRLGKMGAGDWKTGRQIKEEMQLSCRSVVDHVIVECPTFWVVAV
jgi:hypothetical protein